MSRGGKREGAGRKHIEVSNRKNILIGLPLELVEWLDAQPESRAALIANAIRAQRDKPPAEAANSFDDHLSLRDSGKAPAEAAWFDDHPALVRRGAG